MMINNNNLLLIYNLLHHYYYLVVEEEEEDREAVIQLGRAPITQSGVDSDPRLSRKPQSWQKELHHTEKDVLPIICQDDDRPDTKQPCCRKEGRATPIQRGPGPAGGEA